MWLTSTEALARLGSKPQTLYANVSRGRITARPDPEDSRKSLYSSEDVERLAKRTRGRRSARVVAEETVKWGDPIFPSSLSTIVGGRLYYRGQDVVALSRTASLEDMATLLWDGEWQGAFAPPKAAAGGIAAAFVALAQRAGHDVPSYGRAVQALRPEAGSILMTVAAALTGPTKGLVHQRLAQLFDRAAAEDLLRRALVLLADHELNSSTFSARVAISTGTTLAAGTLAGLGALSGPLHGDASAGVFALVDRAVDIGAGAAVREWLGQGRDLPAFGHPLYPDGDIRAAELLRLFALPQAYGDLKFAAEEITGTKANIDFALAGLTAAFDLPRSAPLMVFAMARTVGWLAHMLEQIGSPHLIRPRARYVGPTIPVTLPSQS